jgi:YHS domain-containing protein
MLKNVFFSFLIIVGFAFIGSGDSNLYNQKKGVVLGGTDVVSILNNKPCEGVEKWSTKHEGLTYYFCSEINKSTFKKNPKKHVPAFGGWCAYALTEKPQKVAINPENYKVVNGKLLLFYNTWGVNTLEKWNTWNDDQKYFKLAAENWAKLKAKK